MPHTKQPNLTPEEVYRSDTISLIKKTLKRKYKTLKLKSLSFQESYSGDVPEISSSMTIGIGRSSKRLKSTGVGLVDAAFRGLKDHFLPNYRSLEFIKLRSFRVYTSPADSESAGSTEASVAVMVEFTNAYGKVVPFRYSSSSLTKSVAHCLVGAFEFYINSEACFLTLKELVSDAAARGRHDIKDSYISDMVSIVGVSSYEEVS